MRSTLAALFLLASVSAVSAEEKYDVVSRVVCQTPVAVEIAKASKVVEDADRLLQEGVANGTCRSFMQFFRAEILKVVEGPFKDSDGDDIYVVEVLEEPSLSTWAYPGLNTSLPKGFTNGSI